MSLRYTQQSGKSTPGLAGEGRSEHLLQRADEDGRVAQRHGLPPALLLGGGVVERRRHDRLDVRVAVLQHLDQPGVRAPACLLVELLALREGIAGLLADVPAVDV